jgi:hypothetical protein
MTFLDDYQSAYKIQGIALSTQLVSLASPTLLRKTGVDGLLFQSYQTALTHLHDELAPQLIRAAVPAHLRLIDRILAGGSKERFERLCTLLGDGIIGTIWTYGGREAGVIAASVEVLPEVIQALGIGCARYLKVGSYATA